MTNLLRIAALPALLAAFTAHAGVDAACAPVVKAGLARAATPAWEAVTVMQPGNFRMETIQVGGQSYLRMNGERWKKSPTDFNKAERQIAEQINSGKVKLSQCRDGGDSTIDGTATRMVHYTVTLPGAPAASAILYVGKSDGLPYAQTTDTAKIRYRYRGVTAPKP